jgi:predicted ester cyclase
MVPDVELINQATGETFQGPEGARAFLEGWATAFPDSQVETLLVVADASAAAIEFRGRGTHTGPLTGPAGTLPPTGRTVDIPFAQVFEFDGEKIVRVRLYFDLATMLHQLQVTSA